ncbi:mechanosensitive ion channel domain-containing protein [Halopseudomonas phragmitis]|uniref:Small-conductance mechanosensitive channel n=2 Tax=Pseudomonadaceae TaxID=135621 RepID=A0A1V0B7B2_9GAMM|nr:MULTISPECIES: mechanosensitive ion channel domain-containing protein [Pseudomonadaceae]AQZ95815.1 transporter [Halopseudomonas phragmitis]RHW21464.1 transporter [Pseudomonas jilinensis]
MELETWSQSFVAAMTTLWGKVASFIPDLIAALFIILLGFVVAKIVDTILSKGLAKLGLDRLMTGAGVTKMLGRVGIRAPVSAVVGKIVYWFIVLTFVVSAAETMGLARVSATLDAFALYLPKVFGAALILLAGLLLSHLVGGVVKGAAESIGVDYASSLGRFVQGLLVIITVSLAIGQLQIETALLNTVIAIVLVSFGAAAALALGLGSRQIVGQIVAGVYVRELYQVGDRIKVGELEGIIDEIGTVKTTLVDDEGAIISVSNRTLIDERVSR